jgi:hypothetical protein
MSYLGLYIRLLPKERQLVRKYFVKGNHERSLNPDIGGLT